MLERRILVILVALVSASAFFSWAGELDVLPDAVDGVPRDKMMTTYLLKQVDEAYVRWQADYEKVKTPEEIAAYQQRLRERFLEAIGAFPGRTPLNPQITGVIERDGYRVEKVIFESLPKFFVTAALFLPDPSRHAPPYPGVLVPCGHAENAKAHAEYQSMGALLALNGMAALVFDPISQGERAQFLDENGKPPIWGTKAHCEIGVGSMLVGRNTAWFEIWDGMRGIDYLQSRPEVDPERIGCTGNSGGGTQTSFLMALDERIDVAAPSCFLNRLGRQVDTAMGDAEQNIFGQLAFGMDHADYIIMRASKPTILLAATQDFFEIEATWESFRYAKRIYSRMGYSERVDLLENDEKHNYNTLQREGGVRWLARWLLKKDEPIVEPELVLMTDEEMRCTPEGEVMKLAGARSVFDINRDRDRELEESRVARWGEHPRPGLLKRVRRIVTGHIGVSRQHVDAMRARARELAGVRALGDIPEPAIEQVGTLERDAYRVEKLIVNPEPGIWLPALQYAPKTEARRRRAVLFLHEGGKSADVAAIEALVKEGKTVLAVDIRGIGETQSTSQSKYGPEIGLDWEDFYRAYVLGRTYVGMRAEDILVCARHVEQQVGKDVELVAVGLVGVPALHAAALEPELFSRVTLVRALVSWSNVVECGKNYGQLINGVHGALEVYDLPDLADALGSRLVVEEPVDAMGRVL